jgi:hydrogenase-4 membrane subunit HyfE
MIRRVQTMLMCEVAAVAFCVTSLWFKSNSDQGFQFACLLLALKYMLVGLFVMFTTTRTPEDA